MNTDPQDQPTPLLDYVRAARRRWRTVLGIAALVTLAALAFSVLQQKQYDATVDLLLGGQEPVDQLLDLDRSPVGRDPERELNTQVELIKLGPAVPAARAALDLDRSTQELLEQIETETSPSTTIVALRVRDTDPVMAVRIANAVADAYVRDRLETARRRYTEASELARRRLAALDAADRRSAQGRQLARQVQELERAAALQLGNAEVVRRATVPTDPTRPRPRVNAVLGLVLGLLLGVGVALALELFDRRFKDEEGVERFFGMPIAGALPALARRRGAPSTQPGEREQYGLLAANLGLSNVTGPDRTVLMVTSAAPGEGKTSVTLGLARSCARLGLRVIAIEADLRRPGFTRHVGVTVEHGVAGILDGTANLVDEVVMLDADTLKPSYDGASEGGRFGIVPAGSLPANPQQALSRPGMRQLVDAARSLADVVLIDTSPIGTVNDAVALTSLVDGVVFIVRLDTTTKDAAHRAMRVLTNVGAPPYDIVVTDAASAPDASGYPRIAAAREPLQT